MVRLALAGALSAGVSAQQPIFRSGVRLVETSVLVHDRNGAPVGDLTASDFRVFEDGKPQKIEVFAVEIDRPSPIASAAPTAPAAAPGVFSNRQSERTNGGVTVILLDRLNSSLEDQKNARDQILKFLAKIQPTDRIAFYVLESDVISVLHDFTSDANRLIRVLNRSFGNTSVELARSDETMPTFAPTGNAAEDAEMAAWLERTMLMVGETFLRRRAELTTQALESIAKHLAGVPGRKNLVWVSGAFPLVIPTDHGPEIMRRQVSRAARAINDANIAIYPVDIRGLVGAFVNPATASATTIRGAASGQVFTTMANTHPNQDTMRDLAEATGGRVYLNSNAIGESVRKAIDDSRVSYVLGYYSTQSANDNRFREISVKVNRSGVDVRHRKGYLATAPAPPRDSKARLAALDRVMMSPVDASQIEVTAQLDRRSARDATLAIRLDPSAITWDLRKDVRHGAIDVVIAQSEPDGKYFKVKETTVSLEADADRYQQMVEEGFTLSSSLVLRPAAYRVHVIISDVASQAVGSLIIPIR